MSTMDVVTFRPPQGCRGEDGPAFQGNFRKGELRGIIHINKDNCVGCDTCRKFCPVDAISGGLGAIHKIRDDACVSCGQCLSACPFGAIEQMSFVDDVIAALKDPKKFVVAHPSPAVRVALAEEFGGKPGDLCTDQMLNALEKAGFTVYDVNQTADQTILEEGTEFIKKVRYWCLGERSPEVNMMAHHPLPHFTSCCPGWVRFVKSQFPAYIGNLSTAKSPQQMFGAVVKSYLADQLNVDPKKLFVVSIMPCTAKKMEARREEFRDAYGVPYVDLVLTTQEVVQMMKESGIRFQMLEKESPDLPYGMGSGAAEIFGTSGGVAEAVVRHCLPDKSKNALREISILGLRGDAPIKETTVTIGDTELKLAVVNGLANARKLLKRIDEGEAFYHLIEVMTCQGGCVGGPGQPYGLKATKEKRGDGLHQSDNAAMFKRAERNPIVVRMMAEYGEERCHELLHVSYRGE